MKTFLTAIFNALLWFAIGTALLLLDNKYWNTLGIVLYGAGVAVSAMAVIHSLWDKFIEKTQAMQYLFDSARGLDRERLDALLHALGLKPIPVQQHKTDITIHTRDHSESLTKTRTVFDLPLSPEQLAAFASGVIHESAPVSRREWVDRRHLLNDQQYRNLQAVLEREGIIELKVQGNPNAGFKVSDYGGAVLREYLPSPAPHLEEVQNPA